MKEENDVTIQPAKPAVVIDRASVRKVTDADYADMFSDFDDVKRNEQVTPYSVKHVGKGFYEQSWARKEELAQQDRLEGRLKP